MSTPANAYIEARELLHARYEVEISKTRNRHRNCPGIRRALVGLICMKRRQERLLLWSYHNAAEPTKRTNRTIIHPADGDNGTVTS